MIIYAPSRLWKHPSPSSCSSAAASPSPTIICSKPSFLFSSHYPRCSFSSVLLHTAGFKLCCRPYIQHYFQEKQEREVEDEEEEDDDDVDAEEEERPEEEEEDPLFFGSLGDGELHNKQTAGALLLLPRLKEEKIRSLLSKEDARWSPALEESLSSIASLLQPKLFCEILGMTTDPHLALSLFEWADKVPHFTHDLSTFHCLIRLLGQSQQVEIIWNLLDRMKRSGLAITDMNFNILIRSYGSCGMVEEATRAFESMRNEYNCKPTSTTYKEYLGVLISANWVTEATLVFDQMRHNGFFLDSMNYAVLIVSLCQNGELEKARVLLDDMMSRDCSPNRYIFHALIDGYLKTDNEAKALEILEEMLRRGCDPNIITYRLLIYGFARMDRAEKAAAVLEVMVASGCNPGRKVYNTVIHGLLRKGKATTAVSVYEAMKETGTSPDVVTHNILTTWLCREGKIDEALQFLGDIAAHELSSVDIRTYNGLVDGIFKTGRGDRVLSVFAKMKEQGCDPDANTYSTLINGLVKEGRLPDAMEILDEMIERGITPMMQNKLMDSLFKMGRTEMGIQVFQSMKAKYGVNSGTYTTLLNGLCETGHVNEALSVMEEMSMHGFRPNAITYSTLIDGLFKASHVEGALGAVKKMLEKGNDHSLVTYSTVIYWLCKKGMLEEALELVSEMMKKGYRPRNHVYNTLIGCLLHAGRKEEAMSTYHQMQKSGFILNLVAYNTIVKYLCRDGDVEQAVEVIKHMKAQNQEPDVVTYTSLMDGYFVTGQLELALSTLSAMKSKGFKFTLTTYTALIGGLCKLGKIEDARKMLEDIIASGCDTKVQKTLRRIIQQALQQSANSL